MADEKLDLPEGYDAELPPANIELEEEAIELRNGLKSLRTVIFQQAQLDAKRKALIKDLLPKMKQPVTLLDPMTGEPILATAAQARPLTVKVGDLRAALLEYGFDEDDTETIVASVLKPPEVDTKEGGLFTQQCEVDSPLRIPLEVVAKVAKEKPSSAYISFPKKQPEWSKQP